MTTTTTKVPMPMVLLLLLLLLGPNGGRSFLAGLPKKEEQPKWGWTKCRHQLPQCPAGARSRKRWQQQQGWHDHDRHRADAAAGRG